MTTRKSSASKGKPYCELITVTPAMATDWLLTSNNQNRRKKLQWIKRKARDALAGAWVPVPHQAIAFDPNHQLIDGQNRLEVVIEAGIPLPMYVWFDVPANTRAATDRGNPRGMADILTLSGEHGHVSNNEMGVLRAMCTGFYQGSWKQRATDLEEIAAWDRHVDAVRFSMSAIRRNGFSGVATAGTRGVIARAYYTADQEKLEYFCGRLSEGIMGPADKTIGILWKLLISEGLGGNRGQRQERYAKTERALYAYLRGERLTRLCAATKELFPLPEEMTNAKPTIRMTAQ